MKNYVEHIEELLYLHDCVILPGFGAFICNHFPATLNPKNGIVSPPQKKVLFNKQLKQNDGLLIHWVAKRENIEYERAQRRILLFCEELKVHINQSKKIDFGKIGQFSIDRKYNIIFESKNHNFLPDTTFMAPIFVSAETNKIKYPSIETENGNIVLRMFKYAMSVAVITGIIVIADVFRSDNRTAISNMFPTKGAETVEFNETQRSVISPAYDFVNYDPAQDLPDTLEKL